jgi:hypothetical protein
MADKPELPTSPLTEAAAAFVGIHELFKTLMAAGFTENQALKYLAYTTSQAQPQPPDIPE